jgi:hypothetical protein
VGDATWQVLMELEILLDQSQRRYVGSWRWRLERICFSYLSQLCKLLSMTTFHPTGNMDSQTRLEPEIYFWHRFFSLEVQNMNLKPQLYFWWFFSPEIQNTNIKQSSISYGFFSSEIQNTNHMRSGPSLVNGMLAQPALAGCLVGA